MRTRGIGSWSTYKVRGCPVDRDKTDDIFDNVNAETHATHQCERVLGNQLLCGIMEVTTDALHQIGRAIQSTENIV